MRLFTTTITDAESGWTVEQVLRRTLHLSTTRIKRAKFRPDGISLDGVRVNTARRVAAGQHLELHLPELEENCLESAPGEVDVLYEDEWLLVLNKPAGLPVHPGPGHYADTLGNRLARYYRERGQEVVFRPVNRLDQGTSGLMLVAKRAEAHEALQNLLHTDAFRREYLALTVRAPEPSEGTVELPIAPEPGALNHYRVDPTGKYAKTDYVTLRTKPDSALLKLRLYTGRTHQIRVHMASLGCPLLGDAAYGGVPTLERPALHSWHVKLCHPFLHTWMEWTAPLPKDFRKLGWEM